MRHLRETPEDSEPMPAPEVLTARMVAIGMAFAAEPARDVDVERTVVFASIVGMTEDDLRVLSVLTTWLGVHHARVDAERLARLVREQPSERVRAYWASVAQWLHEDRRFTALVALYDGPPIELLPTGNAFQIQRRGEDPRFVATKLRVPSGSLRDRAADVRAADAPAR